MSYIYNLTDTWNSGATTFAGIKMAVTNTASGASSKLLDLTVTGSTSATFVVTRTGNVGVGTSTPNEAVGYNWLTIDGPSTGGIISLSAATVELFRTQAIAANSVTLATQTAIPLLFSTASTERMRIASSGNVGIGTSSPSEKLHVQGRALIRGSTSGAQATLASDTTALSVVSGTGYNTTPSVSLTLGASNWDATNFNTGFQWLLTTPLTAGGASLAFSTRSYDGTSAYTIAERMRIDASGNVGIGTSNPLARLDIAGGGAQIRAGSDTGANLALWQNTSGGFEGNLGSFALAFFTGANNSRTEKMRIGSDGVVSIGTTTTALYDNNTSGDVSQYWRFQASYTNGVAKLAGGSISPTYAFMGFSGVNSASKSILIGGVSGTLSVTTAGSEEGFLQFWTKPSGANAFSSERMRITSVGNIHTPAGATNMNNGFFYMPAAAGAPTGTPTSISGTVPFYYDATNNNFYVYNGTWKKVALT